MQVLGKWAFPKPFNENQKHRNRFSIHKLCLHSAALYISTSRPCVCCTRHSVHCRRLHDTLRRVHTIYTHTHAHTAFNKKQKAHRFQQEAECAPLSTRSRRSLDLTPVGFRPSHTLYRSGHFNISQIRSSVTKKLFPIISRQNYFRQTIRRTFLNLFIDRNLFCRLHWIDRRLFRSSKLSVRLCWMCVYAGCACLAY